MWLGEFLRRHYSEAREPGGIDATDNPAPTVDRVIERPASAARSPA
jgi:hypothetical protein